MILVNMNTKIAYAHLVLKRNLTFKIGKSMVCNHLRPSFKWMSTNTSTENHQNQSTVQTMADTKAKLHVILGAQKGFKKTPDDRSHLLKLLPSSQDELPVRNMKDSFDEAIIPLSTDVDLQDKYSTIQGFVRRGRLLEDMDIFAVWCAFKHISNPKETPGGLSAYNVVTVLVDQMAFTPVVPEPDADIRLSGHVSWVGKSSLEVTVWIETKQNTDWKILTRSIFLLAARNSTNTGPAIVNKLVATTPEEEVIIKGGLDRKEHRTKRQETDLLKMVPDETEQKTIHKLFTETVLKEDKTLDNRGLPPNACWMRDTKLKSIISSHPQVVFTEGKFAQVATYAEVQDMDTQKIQTTNEFHFTYRSSKTINHVYPVTYNEAMMYVNGRRQFQQAMGFSYPETRAQ